MLSYILVDKDGVLPLLGGLRLIPIFVSEIWQKISTLCLALTTGKMC